MKLYERLGFLRSKRLHRYYLNGNSAYRLVLYLKEGVGSMPTAFDPLPPEAGAGAASDSGYADTAMGSLPLLQQENGGQSQWRQLSE
jgi:peptide alpha-N-acetyltransferase